MAPASEYPTALAVAIARRLRAAREALVRRWLDRIAARVSLTRNHIFPTEELLNHVPLLIDGIADYLEDPASELDASAPVLAKAMELGELRHAQGFDMHEILKEHEILAGVIATFLCEQIDDAAAEVRGREAPFEHGSLRAATLCAQRLAHAVELIRQATIAHFLRQANSAVQEREDQLRRFNRMVSHELKNRVGALRGAASLLGETWLGDAERQRFHRMVAENADGLQRVLENLEVLSRLDAETRQRRNVLLPQAAQEAMRQLRTPAQARGVRVTIADDLPAVEVDAAAVELCLTNYISNAIKYSDPGKSERWVQVDGEFRFGPPRTAGTDAPGPSRRTPVGVPVAAGAELIVRVRDNGLGVPVDARGKLFEHFYRAHGATITGVEGTGLGLSIVRETVESLGGRAWAEFPDESGAVFAFALPSRREEDAAAAGVRRAGADGDEP